MIAFERLSPGPTVPELMEEEWARLSLHLAGWCSRAARRQWMVRWQGRTCLSAASAVLVGARLLLRLRLIEPVFAADAFRLATRLSRAGTDCWQRGRPLALGSVAAGTLLAWASHPAAAQAGSDTLTPSQNERALPGAPESRQAVPGGQTGVKPEEEAPAAGLWDRANLFGDGGGLRSRLADRGLTFGLSETSEVFGNVSGGTRRGVVYEGVTQFGVGLDTGKAFGLAGGTVNVSGYQIHGRGLSLNNLGNNLNTVSSLEAGRGTLLFEAWYEQVLFDKTLAVRVGQLAADQEFMVSQYGGLFTNHTFGWSTLPSTDLPSGGPAYPLATPGVRVKYLPRPDITLLGAVFNGDPAGPGRGNPQDRDASGTAFRLRDGVFAIAEVQYGINGEDGATGLPGTYKLGAYYDSQPFADLRADVSGRSLAASTAPARTHRGDYALYAIADQLVWRRPGVKDGGLGVFARAMGAPGDRNLVNLYLDGGVTYKGLIPGRDSDTVGLGLAYARISDTAGKLDADTARAFGTAFPVRRHETVLEATYQAQLAPWWEVQPTAQYVFNPNGGVPNPRNPARKLGDAAVLGLRTSVTF